MLHGLKKFLEYNAFKIRRDALLMTTSAGSGHPSSVLSCADIVAALFFGIMHFDPNDFDNPNNDRFILSKGHAAPALYAAWALLGNVSQQELMTYRQLGSPLEGHPTMRFAFASAATGSLGMGLSMGVGMALNAKLERRSYITYVLMGDSEITEGSVWEAAEIAAYYKLGNLVGIIDCNRLGQSTQTIHGYHAQRYAQKFEAFGWKTLVIDGHDMQQIVTALEKSRINHDRPLMIIAKTIKGFGIESIENKEGFHGKAFSKEQLEQLLPALEKRFATAASYYSNGFQWRPLVPEKSSAIREACNKPIMVKTHLYKKGDMIATRKAYGQALADVGKVCLTLVSLDAEVKNSTFANIFEEQFPDRFFQCFMAEQNMLGMAIGFATCKKIPFVSTFASFLTRAHDHIRMAAIGQAPIRIVGSHAGISIGQDGPSQMGLEDIAMMAALPDSIILYPADAVSTHALVQEMSNYTKGISYLRTTRAAMPVIYDAHETFSIGGAKVVRSSDRDIALVIAAGITLHEALAAYDLLQKDGISIAVIDLYSIKPFDENLVRVLGKKTNRIITVEDHYLQGGIGQAVCYALRNTSIAIQCLSVTKLPVSGKPKELLAWAGIDCHAIVNAIKEVTP